MWMEPKKAWLLQGGEEPYGLLVRGEEFSEYSFVWVPDHNDSTRLTSRPFFTVANVGKNGAGCLRDKPNNWNMDHGKNLRFASSWEPLRGEDRINDHHLTLSGKREAWRHQ